MPDYIEREAAMAAACKALCHPGVLCPDFKCVEVRDAFNAIPAADVRPVVKGKWKKAPCHETDKAYTYICPFCRWYMIAIEPMNYCPNCGAMMEGS